MITGGNRTIASKDVPLNAGPPNSKTNGVEAGQADDRAEYHNAYASSLIDVSEPPVIRNHSNHSGNKIQRVGHT